MKRRDCTCKSINPHLQSCYVQVQTRKVVRVCNLLDTTQATGLPVIPLCHQGLHLVEKVCHVYDGLIEQHVGDPVELLAPDDIGREHDYFCLWPDFADFLKFVYCSRSADLGYKNTRYTNKDGSPISSATTMPPKVYSVPLTNQNSELIIQPEMPAPK